jgi:hypothetical protein
LKVKIDAVTFRKSFLNIGANRFGGFWPFRIRNAGNCAGAASAAKRIRNG